MKCILRKGSKKALCWTRQNCAWIDILYVLFLLCSLTYENHPQGRTRFPLPLHPLSSSLPWSGGARSPHISFSCLQSAKILLVRTKIILHLLYPILKIIFLLFLFLYHHPFNYRSFSLLQVMVINFPLLFAIAFKF